MTPELLSACTGARIDRARTFAPVMTAAMQEFEIDSAVRQAAFLAQVAHESGNLRWTVELWGPTAAQTGYEGRVDLGNTHPGDGYRYRGRGLIQTTGRDNYKRAGFALGSDLESFPELLAEPGMASRSAGVFWRDHNLNALADAGDFSRITLKINGSTKTLPQRTVLWQAAKTALEI